MGVGGTGVKVASSPDGEIRGIAGASAPLHAETIAPAGSAASNPRSLRRLSVYVVCRVVVGVVLRVVVVMSLRVREHNGRQQLF